MERAATLYGAGEGLRATVGAPLSPSEEPQHEAFLQEARTALGGDRFTRVWECGLDMDLEAAIAFALGHSPAMLTVSAPCAPV